MLADYNASMNDPERREPVPARANGGNARAKALSAVKRKEIAQLAAEARWGKVQRATHSGPLNIGDIELDVAVLEDGSRILSETKFMAAMGMYRSGAVSVRRKDADAPIPLFLAHKNLKPFVDKHLGDVHYQLKPYRTERGGSGRGIPAEMLPKVCEVWMDASRAGVLGPRQEITARKAEMLFRGFAYVGIVALIDEATGYQEVRDRKALEAILDRFLAKELAAWAKRFPDEFYQQIFRLKGWKWNGMSVKRPGVVGKYTTDLVYQRLAPGILAELERLNPKNQRGHRIHKHHQWLTEDIGHPALAQHLYAIIGFMRVADSWEAFHRMVDRAFPKKNTQMLLPGVDVEPA